MSDKAKENAIEKMFSFIEDESGDAGQNHSPYDQMGMLYDAGYRLYPEADNVRAVMEFMDEMELLGKFQLWLNGMLEDAIAKHTEK